MYCHMSKNTFFLLPAVAVGFDSDGLYFVEIALFNFAIGFGGKPWQ